MTLLQMSFSGAVLILAVALLRKMMSSILPRRAFVVLWCVALARLLVPVSLPAVFSAYSLLDRSASVRAAIADTPAVYLVPTAPGPTVLPDAAAGSGPSMWLVLWAAGAILCALYFLRSYLRCLREFRMSLPVKEEAAAAWMAEHPLRRSVALRQSQAVDAPLTYGVLRPVILVPKGMDWSAAGPMAYVLRHEWEHIRHFDGALKLAAAAAVCVHWWNPAVWLLYILLNRDLELACDACVVRAMGTGSRAGYARALIGMEECRSTARPLSVAFNKTAIEERITAVMQARRTSLAVLVLAVLLVGGVTAAFATTSVGAQRNDLTVIPGGDFTQEESRRLFSLWFDGYEKMTVADYQTKIWQEYDTPEDLELRERFSLSEFTAEQPDSPEGRAFQAFCNYYYTVCDPLTGTNWRSRSFSGTSTAFGGPGKGSWAVLEYDITLTVLDGERLTVGSYDKTRRNTASELGRIWHNKTEAELMDAVGLAGALEKEVPALAERLSNDKLAVSIEYGFVPLESTADPNAASNHTIGQSWDETLAPYVPFGLAYVFNPDSTGNGLHMTYQGREVSGITDPELGLWITEHSGISTYGPDAAELYVVYQNGVPTGLRFATDAEQAKFDALRQKNMEELRAAEGLDITEERQSPRGTAEDYASLLALRTDGYEELPLAVFNGSLLTWCNTHYDAMERTGEDAAWEDWGVPLTEEEKSFVATTVQLSRWENACAVTAEQTGQPEQDPTVRLGRLMRSTGDGGWATLDVAFSYHTGDPAHVTVGERDGCVGGLRAAVYSFWETCDMETLLSMTEADVYETLSALAAEYSTGGVTVTVARDGVHFECRAEGRF